MNDMIQEFFDLSLTPEQAENYLEIINLCQYFDIPLVEDDIINEIIKQDRIGLNQVLDNIFNKFNMLLFTIARQLGIEFDIDSDFRDRLNIIQAVMELENLSDVGPAIDIIENEQGETLSVLAKVLAYTTQYTEDDIETCIVRVANRLLERIREVFNEKLPALDDESEVDPRILEIATLYKSFRDFKHDELGPVREYVIEGYPLNMRFEHYINRLKKEHPNLKDEVMALSAVVIAIISKGDEDLNSKVYDMTEHYSENPGVAMRIRTMANKIVNDFTQYRQLKGGA